MKLLKIISDADFFPDIPAEDIKNKKIVRTAVRAVLFNDDSKIALVGSTYLVLPGGGVDAGEELETALKRECREEVGCEIDIIKEIGKTVEYRGRSGGIQESYAYVAKVKKIGTPQTTQQDEIGMKILWNSAEETLQILEREFKELTHTSYHSYFNIEISKIFVEEVIKNPK
jgi:8-oxo-dGTP diphosphatase